MYTWCYFRTVYMILSPRCIPGKCKEKDGLSVELVVKDDSILAIVTAEGCVRRVGENSSQNTVIWILVATSVQYR